MNKFMDTRSNKQTLNKQTMEATDSQINAKKEKNKQTNNQTNKSFEKPT